MKHLSLVLLIIGMTVAMQADACNLGFHQNEIDQGYTTAGETGAIVLPEATAPLFYDWDHQRSPTPIEATCSTEQIEFKNHASEGLAANSEWGMVIKKPNLTGKRTKWKSGGDRCRWLRTQNQV